MLCKTIFFQIKLMLRQRGAIFAFYIILLFVMLNYLNNIMAYQGLDVVQMYHPVKLLLLSDANVDSPYGFYFLQLYPLLVIFPSGFSFFKDRECNEVVFWCTRLGKRNYFPGKLAASFIVSGIVFAVPMLLELILNYLSYPAKALGDPYFTLYDSSYKQAVDGYFLSGIYREAPYFYAFICIIYIAVISGIFSMFTVAVSTFRIRYKVFLFLPVYILLYFTALSGQQLGLPFSTSYFSYLTFCNFAPRNDFLFFTILIILTFLSIVIMLFQSRKDYLK